MRDDIRLHGKIIDKETYLFNIITVLVLNLLAIQGTLSSQMLGIGMLLATSLSIFIWRLKTISELKEFSKKTKIIATIGELMPLALAVIGCLGMMGVIGGKSASLILCGTALGGSLIYIAGYSWALKQLNPHAPPTIYVKSRLLAQAIYGISIAILALCTPSMTVGLGGLIGMQIVFISNHAGTYLLVKNELKESQERDEKRLQGSPPELVSDPVPAT